MCFHWFVKVRSQNIPISGKVVQAKALSIAKNLNCNIFAASNGGLSSAGAVTFPLNKFPEKLRQSMKLMFANFVKSYHISYMDTSLRTFLI